MRKGAICILQVDNPIMWGCFGVLIHSRQEPRREYNWIRPKHVEWELSRVLYWVKSSRVVLSVWVSIFILVISLSFLPKLFTIFSLPSFAVLEVFLTDWQDNQLSPALPSLVQPCPRQSQSMDRTVLALRSNNKEISGLKVKETSQPSAGFLYFNRMKGWLVGPRLSYQRYRQCRERGREGGGRGEANLHLMEMF